jgi:hypothetical protein
MDPTCPAGNVLKVRCSTAELAALGLGSAESVRQARSLSGKNEFVAHARRASVQRIVSGLWTFVSSRSLKRISPVRPGQARTASDADYQSAF